ncbi:MAG: SH3 domain-containing protein [Anaerolineae bacterium]|nr:SH3 domain-containing protein [Anaerolineae bacterium]
MKKILMVGILFVLIAGAAMPVLAQEQTFTVTSKAVLVYAEPRTDSLLIAVMSTGSTLTVLGEQQNGFSKVRIPDGREGWAQLGIESAVPGGTTGGGGVIIMAVDNVRIREQSNLRSRQIGSITWGETASLLAFDASGDWAQVNYKGLIGWVFYAYFRVVEGNVGAVSGIGATPSSTTGSGSTVVALGNVIIREEPRLNARRLTLAGWGDTAVFLGFDETGHWIQVRFGSFTGWTATDWWRDANGNILTSGIAPNTPAAVQPTATVQVPQDASPATGVVVMALGNVRIRNVPDLNGEQVVSIGWGDQAVVLARDAADLWFLIQFNNVTGWVARDWFQVLSGNPGGLPIQQ